MNKQEKIQSIKDIIENYGGFPISESDHESPVLNRIGNTSVLIEYFSNDDVDVTEYVHETVVSEDSIPYENLSEIIINEIFTIVTDFGISQEKMFNSCRNENF